MNILCITVEKENWTQIFRAVNTLLEYGITILWNREEFSIISRKIPPGSFIIPLEGLLKNEVNSEKFEASSPLTETSLKYFFEDECISYIQGDLIDPVNVYKLKTSRVALYEDAVCYNHALVLGLAGFDLDWVSGREVSEGKLEYFNIFMSEGGGAAKKAHIRGENVLLTGMGVEGAKRVSEWVKKGGAYLGCCGGSYIASVVAERFMNWWNPAKRYMTMMNVENTHLNEFSHSGFKSPGQGEFTARNLDPSNPIVFGLPKQFSCTHWNGPVYKTIEGAVELASSAIPVVAFNEVSPDKFTPSEFYFKPNDADQDSIKETSIYNVCKENRCAIYQGFFGLGLVVLSGSHPEMIPTFLGTIKKHKLWTSAQIVANTAFWAASQSDIERKEPIEMVSSLLIPIQPQNQLIGSTLLDIKKIAQDFLNLKLNSTELWLRSEFYTRSFGLKPLEMYEKSLKHILYLSEITEKKITEIDELVIKLNDLLYDVSSKISKSKVDEKKPLIVFYNKIKLTIFKYYKILGKQKPPLWDGAEPHFLGIHELITSAKVSCYRAKEREKYFKDYNSPLFSYQEITDNPFSNMYTAANKLNDALKLIYVYESKIEKIFSIWNLYTNNIKENK